MVAHDDNLRAWLATPDAAERLDVARLDAEHAIRWQHIRTARRRRDWASSRALLAAVPVAAPCSQSLSHSQGYAALIISHPALCVGIDVEAMIPRDFLRMAEVAFSAAEAAHLASLDPEQVPGRFYEFWTLKEAFAKALALPLAEALTGCRCVDDAGNEMLSIPTMKPWRATVFAPRSDLRLAIACVGTPIEHLSGRILTQEWPAPTPSPWPVVLDLVGAAGTCAAASDAAPCTDNGNTSR